MQLTNGLDDRAGWSAVGVCPIERTTQILGNRTALLVLREAFYGTTRFEDFCDRVGMARSVGASRLRALEGANLLRRRSYQAPGKRAREEYILTPAGAELEPIVMGIFSWGRRHVADDAVLDLVHDGCGGGVEAVLECEHGHRVSDTELALTPQAHAH
ncbi:winged helix-turn-helix transcriptional regulator [Microbacterium sp. NPDC058389]|uniref:winged helix-turn-helix transcriptional regulator n=1 Tax=Microbacterium sp. NPDC058389 TaxID=3346475 RepID=UPI00365D0C61